MKNEIDEKIVKGMQKRQEDLLFGSLEDAEKIRIFNRTMAKIDILKEEQMYGNKKRRNAVPKKTFAAVLSSFLVVGLAACAVTYHYSEGFRTYFNQTDEKMEVKGEVVLSEETYEGVTVQVKEIIGDAYGCYIDYLIKNEGETKLLPLQAEEVRVEGLADSLTILDPVLVGEEGDAAEYIVGIRTSENIQNKECRLILSNPGAYDAADNFVTAAAHDFSFDLLLGYEDCSTEIEAGQEISIYGGKAVLEKISISPLSVTVFLKETEKFRQHASDLKEGEPVNDELIVRFMDGSIRDSYRVAQDYDIFHDTTVISMGFHRIVSMEEIENITFAGVTIPIHENASKEEEFSYQSNEMGIIVNMQKALFDLVTPSEPEEEAGEMFMDFQGEKDGVSMKLFTVYRTEGFFTAEEMKKKEPKRIYLEGSEDYTYSLRIWEPENEEEGQAFLEIRETYLAKLKERIRLTAYSKGKVSGSARVAAEVLKVRKEPSFYADTVALLPKEEAVELLETDGEYYKISFQEGKTGYVLKQYLLVDGNKAAGQ